MVRRQMELAGASKEELAGYDRGVAQAGAMGVDVSPLVGDIKGFIEVFTGRDLMTGDKLGFGSRLLGLFMLSELRTGKKLGNLLELGKLKKFTKLGDLSKLEGVGAESLQTIVNKVNNIGVDHLKNSDLTGAILDISGNPVTINGRTFNHLGEVKDALKGLGNQLKKLNKLINSGNLGDDVLKAAKSIRTQVQNQKDQIQNVLNRAIDEVGN